MQNTTYGQSPNDLLPTSHHCTAASNPLIITCITAPVITCPSIYYGCPGEPTTPDQTGSATAIPGDDNCDAPIITYTDEIISSGPCTGATEIHRTWLANYPNNSNPFLYAECTQLILLHDADGPTIASCPPSITTTPDSNCEASVTWAEPTATDDCGLESLTSTHTSGQVFPAGTTTVVYTATDLCGNTSTCAFDIIVSGTCCMTAPELTCPSTYLGCPSGGLDPSQTGIATAIAGSDYCDTPEVTYTDETISTGPCAGSTEILRTWTATYPSLPELSSTCQQSIVLADTKAPLISNCPSDITVSPNDECSAAVTWVAPTATDNCGIPAIESDIANGSSFAEGQTTVTYTSTDACGNTASCTFNITVTTCCDQAPVITCPTDVNGCPGTDLSIDVESNCTATNTQYTGWGVATCNADAAVDEPVGVIYDVRQTGTATPGSDWAPVIDEIHPANWTLGAIGQVFGIAIGHNDNVYLAASDVYDTQYNIDPYGPGQIFRAQATNAFIAEPFVDLPNTGGPLNGIGNIVFDKVNNQLFASNLEDGKLYRISHTGAVLDAYDPWSADTGAPGIAPQAEQVWGIGLTVENGVQKLYFPRVAGATRAMYAIILDNGNFPSVGSEVLLFDNIAGEGDRITDIAFSDDGTRMIFSERGTKFTTGAHNATTQRYDLVNGQWTYDLQYFIGAWVTEQFPNIQVETGQNSAGGVDFGATNTSTDGTTGCDALVWNTMNYFRTPNGNLYYGMQGMDVDGNNPNGTETDPNYETDIIIDFDGQYNNFVQKGDLGDVEIFKSGGNLLNTTTGIATATSASNCGVAIITFTDAILSEGPCEGGLSLQRTWTATDSNNPDLVASCVQSIVLEDSTDPVLISVPQDITLAPDANCSAIASWTAPTATDDCGVATIVSDYESGSSFTEGPTLVTYTATDHCGNTSTASFTVTVTQCCIDAPLLTCPPSWTACIGTDTNPSTTGMAMALPGSNVCETPIVSYADHIVSTGPCAGAKHIIRTWTAKDPDNTSLTSTCDQVIILADTEAPVVFNCPADITVTTSGSTSIATWIEPTASDDCALEWIMGDYQPGDSFPLGTTTVTYTAVDFCENVTPCTFTVTVESVGGVTCPDDIVISCSGSQGTVVTWALPELETSCPGCIAGDSITGFIYMGTLHGSKYYCSTSPAASSSATAIAQSYGGYLATITSAEENNYLASQLANQCALIGYTDASSEGHFVWANGETSTYTNWATGQPNNDNGNQDCTVLCSSGWNDSHCEIAYEYIMEIPCTSYEQTTGPASGSVFEVGTEEITYVVTDQCGNSYTCSFDVTVENSAYLNCPEDHTFTCPTGQNGVIAHWQTPTLTSCCTDCSTDMDSIAGFMYMGSYEGSKYYCSLTNVSWPQAQAQSAASGGQLAEVNTEGENEYLANLLTLQRAWIGLSDTASEGNFTWTSGAPLDYTNWYPGQPNNQADFQDYVSMLSNGQWNDEYDNITMEYIMEIPCYSVTQIAGPPTGSVIPTGTTTITYAGADACGNTDTCSFDITIIAPDNCPSYGIETWYMWIENIGLGDYTNVSGNNGGYGDFTSDNCIDVHQGVSYPITLTPGYTNALYTVYWKIWIDYNQDGDYYDAGEYVGYGSGHQQISGILPIAANCLTGETTMRVAMKYGSYPTGPCEVFSHGEVEDYCINISATGSKGSGVQSIGQSGDEQPEAVQLAMAGDAKQLLARDLEADILEEELQSAKNLPSAELTVYPNPATSNVTLELDATNPMAFRLYDAQGKVVLDEMIEFVDGVHTINLSNHSAGAYYLRSVDGRYSKKIVLVK